MNTEKMNDSTVNFTPEESTNSTTHSIAQVKSLEICIFSLHFLFGLPTHSYVIWLIITGTRSGVASEFFNLNHSICEIGSCLNALFSLLTFLFSSLRRTTHFLQGLAITGRPVFQCLMCVERYLAVVHPVTFLKFKPLRYRVICSTVVWIITLGSCVCCMFTLGLLNTYVWFYSLQFLLFFFIQLFCLVSILRALKKSGPGKRKREKEEENLMKRKAFFLIVITTVNVIIFYMPFIISGFSFILTQKYINELFFFSFTCNVLISFVQPALYLCRVGTPLSLLSIKHCFFLFVWVFFKYPLQEKLVSILKFHIRFPVPPYLKTFEPENSIIGEQQQKKQNHPFNEENDWQPDFILT